MSSFFTDPRHRLFLIIAAGVIIIFAVGFPFLYSWQNGNSQDIERLAAMRVLEAALEQYAGRVAIMPFTEQTKENFVCADNEKSGLSVLSERGLLKLWPKIDGDCVWYRSDGEDYKFRTKLKDESLYLQDNGTGSENGVWFEVSTVGAREW